MVRIEDQRRLISAEKGHNNGKITKGKTADDGKGTKKKYILLWGRGFHRLCESFSLRLAVFTVLWFEAFTKTHCFPKFSNIGPKQAGNPMSIRIAPILAN